MMSCYLVLRKRSTSQRGFSFEPSERIVLVQGFRLTVIRPSINPSVRTDTGLRPHRLMCVRSVDFKQGPNG